jgi:transposase InsO family protein
MMRVGKEFDIPKNPDPKCEACIKGKAHVTKLPTTGTRATELLHTVVGDIFVSPIPTFAGCKYLTLYTDDFSNFVAGNLHKSKTADHTLQFFKSYKAQFENITGKSIKIFRADQGGEFKNNLFDTFLKSAGIFPQFACAGSQSHGQNGCAERINRTLIERALSMMWHAGMESSYWGEAVLTAIYLHNRLPNSEGISPYEMVMKQKPNLLSLKT